MAEVDVSDKAELISNDGSVDAPEKLPGCGGTLACDPRGNLHRYLVLIIMCFLSFGGF